MIPRAVITVVVVICAIVGYVFAIRAFPKPSQRSEESTRRSTAIHLAFAVAGAIVGWLIGNVLWIAL